MLLISQRFQVSRPVFSYRSTRCLGMRVLCASPVVSPLPYSTNPERLDSMRDSSSGRRILHQTSTFSTTATQACDRVRAFAEARCAGYEVLGPLGHGGGGKVFRVRNLETGSLEAMKVLGLPPCISVTALERVRR